MQIAVENSEPAVLGGGSGDRRVGGRNPVGPVAALSQLAKRAHGRR